MTTKWDDDLFRRLWEEGKSMAEIAATAGVTDSCASKHAMALGLPRRRPGSYAIPALRCEALYKSGIRTPKLAKLFGVSRGAVIRLLRARKIYVGCNRIENDPRTFVCTRLRRRGWSIKAIAKHVNMRYDVVAERIRKILGPGKHGGRR